jgi:Glycosyltransferase family 87
MLSRPTPIAGQEMVKKDDQQTSCSQDAVLKSQDSLLERLWAIVNKPVILAVLWLGVVMHLVGVLEGLPQRAAQTDFSVYYASAAVLREGGNPYTTDITAIAHRFGLDVGPLVRDDSMPFFLLCFEPLTRLSPKAAYWAWFGMNCAALALAMTLLLMPLSRGKLALVAFMLLYQPLAEHFVYARTEILILLMLVLMFRWLEEGHEAAAGLILALAGALRAFPLAMAGYLLLRGHWRALFYTAVGLAVTGIVTVAALGLPLCLSFAAGALFSSQYQFAAMFLDISLGAFVSRLFWYLRGPNLPHSVELLRVAGVICAELGVLALTVRATLASFDKSRAFSSWVVTSIILSPIAWVHYMVLVFIPFGHIARAANQGRPSERAIWAMIASYLLLKIPNDLLEIARHRHSPVLFFGIGELYLLTIALAYVSVYWFVLDSAGVAADLNGEAVRRNRRT